MPVVTMRPGPTTYELAARFGVNPGTLCRWRRAGWIDGEPYDAAGEPLEHTTGHPITWQPWVPRMVAMLTTDALHRGHRRQADVLRAVAVGLAQWPDAVWFVILDGEAIPSWDDADAVELARCTDPELARTMVSPPMLEGDA